MSKTRLNELTASQLLPLITSRQCSPKEVWADCSFQIEKLEKNINAWAYIDPELSQRYAKEADAKLCAGKSGSLAGIPIGIKDIFNTRDMPTQMGSPIWKDFTPGNDARVVHNLRMADAVVMGKTVTAEFAVHTPGPTRNPFNADYMAGTSSTGSAVAVACRMVPLALGTQTAGSVIRPASYNGVYGFKPSFGLIPRTGMLKTTDSLDSVGMFARSVHDLELLFEIVRVRGKNYPISDAALNDPKRVNVEGRSWKVAVIKGPKWKHAEPYAQQALIEFADKLGRERGIELYEATLPGGLERAHAIHATIYDRTLSYYFSKEFEQETLVSETMYEIIRRGNAITAETYVQALQTQNEIAREMDLFFGNGFDIVLDLSTGGEALKGVTSEDRPDNCLIWTLCGLPVVNIPAFSGPNNLPFGLQIVGRRYNDYMAINFIKLLITSGHLPENIVKPMIV